jgi:acetyl-CoA carboxylase / biotin carboxylase 1
MQYNILIANRGLTALKFILSMKEWLSETQLEETQLEETQLSGTHYNVKMFGFVTPVDMTSKYKYITMLDQAIYTDNNSVYTNIDEIIHFCKEYKINCLFPGWGYLSENEHFVKALNKNGILFLGPTYENMCAIGNKISCNDVAEKLGVPVLPWSNNKQLTTIEEIEKWCDQIGYPVMLKAGNSGGGKGIRIVREKHNCYEMWQEILKEVVSPMIYATKYIENASHLEIQILGDGETSIHLHGRDCTTQRRNQKLIEECPIQKDKEIVDNIQNYAVKIANHIGYKGLATVEFIYDQDTKKVYILEVNPRIQVEHIITEQLFGLNLIKMLFLVSIGTKLHQIADLSGINYEYDKHIISVRINSENPYEDFRPTLGKISEIDITYNRKSWGYFSVANDAIISETVDSQFGHISAFGKDRISAIRNLTNLIDGLKIRGTIYNTAGFLKNFINDDIFKTNHHTTRFLNYSSNTQLFNTKYKNEYVVVLGMIYNSFYINDEREKECLKKLRQGHNYHLKELNQFSKAVIVFNNTLYEYEFLSEINTNIIKKYIIRYNGVCYTFSFKYEMGILNIVLDDNYMYSLIHSYHDDYQIEVLINQHKYNFVRKVRDNKINSPAGGKVIDLLFTNGDTVNAGDIFVKIECMKMILPFKIDKSGVIRYFVSIGDVVSSNQIIGEIDEFSSVKHEYLQNLNLMNGFCVESKPNLVIDKNAKMLISMTQDKQPLLTRQPSPGCFRRIIVCFF